MNPDIQAAIESFKSAGVSLAKAAGTLIADNKTQDAQQCLQLAQQAMQLQNTASTIQQRIAPPAAAPK